MLYGGGLRPPSSRQLSGLPWVLVVCCALGAVGLFALTLPLFGFLSYLGALVFPLVVLAQIGFGGTAVIRRGRWFLAYALGNLGLVAGNAVIVVIDLAVSAVSPHWSPDPSHWAPVYFGVVLMGLAGGIVLALRIRSAPGRS
jgi:hypothetical protein